MHTRLVFLTLAAAFLSIPVRGAVEPTEAEFRAAVQRWSEGSRSQQTRAADSRASAFAIKHEDIAIPILVNAVKAKLRAGQSPNDKQIHYFMWAAVELATYNAGHRAADAVADLCAVGEASCSWMVELLLNQGTAQQHPFGTAYDVVERYPGLRGFVLPWIEEKTTKDSSMAMRFAQELLKRQKEGHRISENDALLSGLSPSARNVIGRAVETERAREERRR
jgi:hypothetical protein